MGRKRRWRVGRIECQVDEEKCLKYSFFSILVLVMYKTSDFKKSSSDQQKVGWGTRLVMYDVLVIWMNNASHS